MRATVSSAGELTVDVSVEDEDTAIVDLTVEYTSIGVYAITLWQGNEIVYESTVPIGQPPA